MKLADFEFGCEDDAAFSKRVGVQKHTPTI
jgi:hypothetical protein